MEILLESLIDCLKMLPWIFLTYIVIELIERKASFAKNGKFLSGNNASLFGAIAGIFPQCGVSVMSAKLFEKGVIRIGTLFAVFIATSDEAISILIASGKWGALLALIVLKFVLAVSVGGIMNTASTRKIRYGQANEAFEHEDICAHCHDHAELEGEGKWSVVKKYILVPILHSLQTFLYIFVITAVFGIFFGEGGIIGEEKFALYLSSAKFFEPFLAGLVGLIPNCASSAILSSAYINGMISFGSLFGGLCVNAGVGLAVLFRNIKETKRNFKILISLYFIGAVSGLIVAVVMSLFGI